jgi:hypothetical protein
LLGRHVLERWARPGRGVRKLHGVGDEHVDPVPAPPHRIDRRADRIRLGQVKLDRQGLATDGDDLRTTFSASSLADRYVSATRAPSPANASAVARPIPREPPVINTTRSDRPRSICAPPMPPDELPAGKIFERR